MTSTPMRHEVVITVADDNRADIEGLTRKLAAKGLVNASALANVGIITGHVEPHAIEGLRSEPGIASVELAGVVQIPPPNSEVQ